MNSQPPSPNRPLILIVDDEPVTRRLLRVAMEEEGYRAIDVKNAAQCLDEYRRLNPDMVLLDAIMPEMDGFTCCESLRSLAAGNHLPILMITALDDRVSIDRAFAAGATDYITKPIYWAVLSQRVKRLLNTSTALKQLDFLQRQFTQQQPWEQLLHQLAAQLRHTFKLQTLFNTVVAELRTLVAAERVAFYRKDGTLWAESTKEGFPSLKSLSGDDITAFNHYQERYKQGQMVILDLCQPSILPDAAIAPLKQLTVLTATMFPVMRQNELWGILCFHHCQTPKLWESWELKQLSYLVDLLAIASLIRPSMTSNIDQSSSATG